MATGKPWLYFLICLNALSLPYPAGAVEHGFPKTVRVSLEYAPAPVDNPLKGLVPYLGDHRHRFPHSLEFRYFKLAELVKNYGEYDWRPLEVFLDDVASRGHQAVFRVALEFPTNPKSIEAIPEFLIKDGLRVHIYPDPHGAEGTASDLATPDYQDERLRRVLRDFVTALGAKYDGDVRIGFITAGLLGYWGEWHTHPRNELFPSKEVQQEVMDAYERAFCKTPILLRYPAGGNHYRYAANYDRKFGYHDDSFAWATLETGKKEDRWFFLALMRDAGPRAMEKWKYYPIGGEIRPEAWGKVFDEDPGDARIQDFLACVEATHVTWLMDSGMFSYQETAENPERRKRAEEMVRRMGYEFYVSEARVTWLNRGLIRVEANVENRGVAPFYYDWPVEFGLIDERGEIARLVSTKNQVAGILPNDPARTWQARLSLRGLKRGQYVVAVRVENPLPNGNPIRFANQNQDSHKEGWLSLLVIER